MQFWVIFMAIVAASLAHTTHSWWTSPRARARRALRRLKNTPIADLKPGVWTKIIGVARPLGSPLTSPISERPCIGYRLEVERQEGLRTTELVLNREECGAFLLTDATGEVQLKGPFLFGLNTENDWSSVPRKRYGVLENAGLTTGGGFLFKRFVFREALLQEGDRVCAVGLAFAEPDAESSSGSRSAPLRARLSGSAEQPVVIADAHAPASS